MRLMIAVGIYLLLLALILIFNHGAHMLGNKVIVDTKLA